MKLNRAEREVLARVVGDAVLECATPGYKRKALSGKALNALAEKTAKAFVAGVKVGRGVKSCS